MVREKIAACVVLYHPPEEALASISSYYSHVDYLIAIDNSEHKNPAFETEFKSMFPRSSFAFQGRNTGIASALNIASKAAAAAGYKWLLTMDQDSHFEEDGINQLVNCIEEIERRYDKTGIITPYHLISHELVPEMKETYTEKQIAMTSGNLLNLEAYAVAGDFDEKLFIDYVDYEYCLRLRHLGFKIIQNNSVWLKHSLGNFMVKRLFGMKISVSNHNYLRWYYKTRNSLYVGCKYAGFDKRFLLNVLLRNLLFEPVMVVLLFENNKLLKLKSIGTGIIDFLKGRYGKKQLPYQ